MTNPNAFNFGTKETSNFWADRMDPVKEAQRQARITAEQEARDSQQRQMVENYQRNKALNYAAPSIVSAIQTYTAKGEMADTNQVASDVAQMLPDAAPGLFQQVLSELKASGQVYEIQNPPGLMGMRSSHLYLLDG
ncbi:hypothetical protein ACIRL0_10730 [Streptomyces sp. NPDC102365]|uniref:hypothetical protein n=1 Tax=Streptomyces sp. NPDC102365 TaxID=3366162 RepID=UPI00380758E1